MPISPSAGFPDAPKIVLGGQEWPVPAFALRQNIPLQTLLGNAANNVLGKDMGSLTQADVDCLVQVAVISLSRAHPGVTLADIEDLPITVPELLQILPTVMEQTGLYKRKVPAPGEAEGPTSP